ncbi:Tn7 transposase TnsA N-terminal domain-containing protein [Cocleimonas sp. KMM 6892]|uniref:Tn7 transposase TnsA N-terminal domain-containing protein n=1 Tax=unclassified Cocleimonas TaxID=2639732 RepID=UPI002DBAE8B5|nr:MULTISPECIES: Tn7 transposase TnsA N-terminal domain-containing protein [unclassified Cocleimonas]MEB8432591.1 Tn7 transposase TnsA N-terminal domain-containing protein [Cocleimonas sp. KMM 6892]MEC4715450.1 Tn7 transposase TnsA N-terminal domain-containing protein [Cocleimonas sp. KMM 6895]MEC4744931.1 Tn7 transposase TnsA N-terminal domain-containing protein [Cocleimonas sp. KMM 6896]
MSIHSKTCYESLNKSLHESLSSIPINGVLQGKRKLTKGLSGKRVVFFPSKKNKALMPCESRLEADNCLDLEFDTSVISYRTQPFTIDLSRKQSYTPDSIHLDKLGNLVAREVKFSGALEKEELRDRLDYLRNLFSKQNITFQILTEKSLQLPAKNRNYKFLYRCSHQKFDEMQINSALELFDKLPIPRSLNGFRHKCNRCHLPPLIADTLLFLRLLDYDENQVLSPNSQIWIAGGEA